MSVHVHDQIKIFLRDPRNKDTKYDSEHHSCSYTLLQRLSDNDDVYHAHDYFAHIRPCA